MIFGFFILLLLICVPVLTIRTAYLAYCLLCLPGNHPRRLAVIHAQRRRMNPVR